MEHAARHAETHQTHSNQCRLHWGNSE
jgi:hypothetical protein